MKLVNEAWYPPERHLGTYVDVDVEAIATDDDGCFRVDNDDDADFFSVYLRDSDGLAECVADVRTRERAEALAETLALSMTSTCARADVQTASLAAYAGARLTVPESSR